VNYWAGDDDLPSSGAHDAEPFVWEWLADVVRDAWRKLRARLG
jgi:hypothetical protein